MDLYTNAIVRKGTVLFVTDYLISFSKILTSEPAYITDTSLSIVVVVIASVALILLLDVSNTKNIIGKKIVDKIVIFPIEYSLSDSK